MAFPQRVPGRPWEERSSSGSQRLGTETLMGTQSHSRAVSCCAQKKTLGVIVVDKEQRNTLLTLVP